MAKHNLKEFNMTRFRSIHNSGKKASMITIYRLFSWKQKYIFSLLSDCALPLYKELTCDQAVLLPFCLGDKWKGTARYINFTRRLPVIQNLDFCLTGWKTKDTLESCHGCYKQLPVQLDTSWPLSLRNVIKGRGLGISPSYYEHEPQLFS